MVSAHVRMASGTESPNAVRFARDVTGARFRQIQGHPGAHMRQNERSRPTTPHSCMVLPLLCARRGTARAKEQWLGRCIALTVGMGVGIFAPPMVRGLLVFRGREGL
jgi:hypothetical protein